MKTNVCGNEVTRCISAPVASENEILKKEKTRPGGEKPFTESKKKEDLSQRKQYEVNIFSVLLILFSPNISDATFVPTTTTTTTGDAYKERKSS